MRIEILVDNDDPKIYPLDRPSIMVGSHDSCDIVIGHKSISRKHLLITVKGEQFFVADQGSANGSYINEHRLVPGSNAEFSSFFPVRLGKDVLVSLLSDEEAQDLGPDSEFNSPLTDIKPDRDESTKMISLKDLNKSTTSGLVKKRTASVTKRKVAAQKKVAPKKKTQSNSLVKLMAAALLAGAGYYQFVVRPTKEIAAREAALEAEVKARPVSTKVVEELPVKRIDESQLPEIEQILGLIKSPKCTTDIQKYLCSTFPLIYQEKFGTVQIDKNIIIVANGEKYALMAKTYLKTAAVSEGEEGKPALGPSQLDLSLISLMLWMNENIPFNVTKLDGMDDFTLTVVLIDQSKEQPKVVSGAVFVPESLVRLRQKIQDKHFDDAKKNGVAEFSYALEYLRFL